MRIENGAFSWGDTEGTETLRNINLAIPKGSLVAVIGEVGSGKSSLIAALLGEMEKHRGTINTQVNLA